MAFYSEYPHTRNYDDDQREIIHLYKKMIDEYEALKNVYDNVSNQINQITEEQLQKWLDDGTLADDINQTLFNTKLTSYANVAAMKADTTLVAGKFVTTQGYYSVGDYGDGIYLTVADAPDVGWYESLNNGLFAVLLQTKFNFKSCGGVADNVTDQTQLLNRMLNDRGIRSVFIPRGNYLINGPVNVPKWTEIHGEGVTGAYEYAFTSSTHIKCNGATNVMFNISNTTPFNGSNNSFNYSTVYIHDLCIDSDIQAPCAIYFGGYNITIERVQILHFTCGIYADYAYCSYVKQVNIMYTYKPFTCRNTLTTLEVSECYFGGVDAVTRGSQIDNAYIVANAHYTQLYHTGFDLLANSGITIKNTPAEKYVYGVSVEQLCYVISDGLWLEAVTTALFNFNTSANISTIIARNFRCWNSGTAPYNAAVLAHMKYFARLVVDTVPINGDFEDYTHVSIPSGSYSYCQPSLIVNGQSEWYLPITLNGGTLATNKSTFIHDMLNLSFRATGVTGNSFSIGWLGQYAQNSAAIIPCGYLVKGSTYEPLVCNVSTWTVTRADGAAFAMSGDASVYIHMMLNMNNRYNI